MLLRTRQHNELSLLQGDFYRTTSPPLRCLWHLRYLIV